MRAAHCRPFVVFLCLSALVGAAGCSGSGSTGGTDQLPDDVVAVMDGGYVTRAEADAAVAAAARRTDTRRTKVAEVSKKWFRLTDSYGVEIESGQNDILILAITVAIDMMVHD